ncbi:glycosyltransferase family 2 protein [bacterium]|nr:MAG: glycosyltransferase family 2 protein [bacterium]
MTGISVITAASRELPVLKRLMAQFAAQTNRDFEHIIVYDGPPPEEIKEYFRGIESGAMRFIWLAQKDGRYGSEPRNHGIGLSRGDWIVFADDDDYYAPSYLEAFRELNLEEGELGVVRMNNYGTVVPRHDMHEFPRLAHVGTPCCLFAGKILRENEELRWTYDNNYDHDYQFVKRYVERVKPRVRLNPRVVVKAGNASLFAKNKLSGRRLEQYLSWREPNFFAEWFNPVKNDCRIYRKLNELGRLFAGTQR